MESDESSHEDDADFFGLNSKKEVTRYFSNTNHIFLNSKIGIISHLHFWTFLTELKIGQIDKNIW